MNKESRHVPTAVIIVASLLFVACTVDSAANGDSATASTVRADSAGIATSAAGVNVDANNTPPASPTTASEHVMNGASFAGIPPLRIGMSEAEARKALGMPASSTKGAEECHYLDDNGRMTIYVMVVRDTVARLDVHDNTIATDAGIRVGNPESRVMEAYRGRVKTEPHKYVEGGHYLIVTAPSDTTRALLFETDGKRVTSWRVGRTPEVHWVEGCS